MLVEYFSNISFVGRVLNAEVLAHLFNQDNITGDMLYNALLDAPSKEYELLSM